MTTLAAEYKAPLAALNKTLSGSSIDEFVEAVEHLMQVCSIVVKKIDKKKDRYGVNDNHGNDNHNKFVSSSMIMVHKHSLLDKLTSSTDAALTLHLAVLAIFTISQQSIVHASGKHVSAILSFLQPVLSNEQSLALRQYHG